MAKFYALDNKLMCGGPEVRIGDRVYSVDDRKKTVVRMMDLTKKEDVSPTAVMEESLKLGLGAEAAKEIEKMDLSFAAYTELVRLVTDAMIGEEPEKMEERFQNGGKA